MAVEWVDELPPDPRGTRWAPILRDLDKRPGQWAIVATEARVNRAATLRRTYRDYEFTIRIDDKGTHTIYARRRVEPSD